MFRVIRGEPSDAELAALTVVLAAVVATPATEPTGPKPVNHWSSLKSLWASVLWVPETLYASCDLLILVDQTAEPVVSTDVVDHGGGAVRKGP